jgi:hypothetical protein
VFAFNTTILPFASFRLRATSPYDVDPLVGTTAVPGYNELSLLYASYRVTCSATEFKMTNNNTGFPLQIVVWPTNADLGAAMSGPVAAGALGQPYAKESVVSVAGGPTVTIRNTITVEKMYGDRSIYSDSNFSSLVNTIPNNNVYWNYLVNPHFATPATAVGFATVTMGVEFFDRIMLPV